MRGKQESPFSTLAFSNIVFLRKKMTKALDLYSPAKSQRKSKWENQIACEPWQ
uniref:Uncharacterized protein n=1 Tax=Arundo donax TaxID=35708 RepID=A0A0A9HKR5_ARUDO